MGESIPRPLGIQSKLGLATDLVSFESSYTCYNSLLLQSDKPLFQPYHGENNVFLVINYAEVVPGNQVICALIILIPFQT